MYRTCEENKEAFRDQFLKVNCENRKRTFTDYANCIRVLKTDRAIDVCRCLLRVNFGSYVACIRIAERACVKITILSLFKDNLNFYTPRRLCPLESFCETKVNS